MPPLKSLERFVQQLNSAIKNAQLYPAGHVYISQPVNATLATIREIHTQQQSVVSVGIAEGMIWVQNVPIQQASMWDSLMMSLRNAEKTGFQVVPGVADDEWSGFIAKLIAAQKPGIEIDDAFSPHIRVIAEEDEAKAAMKVYREALEVAKTLVGDIRLGKVPKVDEVKVVVDKMVDQVLKHRTTMMALTMMKSYDNYLFQHSVNVGILSLALGESLGLSTQLLRDLGTAAILHDLGKVDIDPAVVLKPDRLTDEEWAVMKMHPTKGHELLKKMEGISDVAFHVALEHHIRFDLQGYPPVPADYKLHPASMILSICDCYDAMTTHRVYQKSHDPKDALEKMSRMAGSNFEPNYLKAFIKMLGIYPQGTLVKLSTGETGVVARPNPASPDEPVVKIVFDVWGNKLEQPRTVDLYQHPVDEGMPVTIVGTVSSSWYDIDVSEHLAGA